MNVNELIELPLYTLSRKLASGELSSREATAAYLQAIKEK